MFRRKLSLSMTEVLYLLILPGIYFLQVSLSTSEVTQMAGFLDSMSLQWAACTPGKFFCNKSRGVISMTIPVQRLKGNELHELI